jgi:hypothetical protein
MEELFDCQPSASMVHIGVYCQFSNPALGIVSGWDLEVAVRTIMLHAVSKSFFMAIGLKMCSYPVDDKHACAVVSRSNYLTGKQHGNFLLHIKDIL